ncbi:sugar ABC transporter permease [Mycoplasmatota bacterium]|nr:sugar ABC transporter permease [Mycoplasmatota bacterium]
MEVKQNIGMQILHAIKHFFIKIGVDIYHKFKNFGLRFKNGSTPTKISHFVMGYGNLARKQIYKGLIFLLLQCAFVFVFIASPKVNDTPIGFKALGNLITLGTEEGDIFTPADNSMLMLLFGVLTIGLISMFIATYLSNIKSSVFNDERIAKGLKPRSIKEDIFELTDSKFHILMLTPAIIGIIIFTVLPTIFMILIAFTNYDSTITAGAALFEWVGFDNFITVLKGQGEVGTRFIPVLTWTLIWAVIATFSNYFLGILLGTLINKKTVRFKKVWRTVFIMTIAIPQFISLLAMRNLLSEYGPVNNMLQQLGILSDSFAFLSEDASPFTARVTVLFINLWVGIPYTMRDIFIIPADLYEPAIVDVCK